MRYGYKAGDCAVVLSIKLKKLVEIVFQNVPVSACEQTLRTNVLRMTSLSISEGRYILWKPFDGTR